MGTKRSQLRHCAGQASVEYALVLLAFLATIVGFYALWQLAKEGEILQRAQRHSSYNFNEGITVGLMQDLAAH